MDVILDSNIFRSDLPLKSKEIEVLIDYLYKSKSSLLMPKIILEEIRHLYRRQLIDNINKYRSICRNIRGIIFDINTKIETTEIDIEEQVENYINFVKRKFNITNEKIIDYKPEYLNEVVARATQRKKPCGTDGQGFRDTILWLTILDCAKSDNNWQIVFISSNTEDFANKETSSLHEDLLNDIQKSGIDVYYYKEISNFLEKHQSNVEYISEDWMLNELRKVKFEDHMKTFFNKEDNKIYNWYERNISEGKERTNYFNVYEFYLNSIGTYSVFELTDGKVIITTELACEMQIEFEFTTLKNKDKYVYRYEIETDPETGYQTMELVEPSFPEPEFQHQYEEKVPEVFLEVTITIQDKIISEFQINQWSM